MIAVFGPLVINATIMLISPRAWFRFPEWIRLSGALSEKKYGSGLGALEIRLVGAIVLGLIAWIFLH